MMRDVLLEDLQLGLEVLIVGLHLDEIGEDALDLEVLLDGLVELVARGLGHDRRVEHLLLHRCMRRQLVGELGQQQCAVPCAAFELLEQRIDLRVLSGEQCKDVGRALRSRLG